MPDDEKPQRRDLTVFRGIDGGYYVESAPGAGPRHHDDLPLDPEAMQRAALAPDLDDEVKEALRDAHGPLAPLTLLLGAAQIRPRQGGSIEHLYLPDDSSTAHAHARRIRGVVVAIAVLADYRRPE
jgi:hypothetical protein